MRTKAISVVAAPNALWTNARCLNKALFLLVVQMLLWGVDSGEAQRKEKSDYYKKWLEADVVYIITEEERTIFEKLTNPEEKDAFIEQFWLRRDPNSRTGNNEFKEEHYRRIAYANERFASGKEGWATDRGRTYIMFGPPKSIDRNPTGEVHIRTLADGGGETFNYPYEVWYYNYIEGIGSGISLEFIDPSFSGQYSLALHPSEKDALLMVPGAGLTLDEAAGTISKRARIDALFMQGPSYAEGHTVADMTYQTFENLQRYFELREPPEFKYKDLQAVVTSRIRYGTQLSLNLGFTYQYFYLDENHCLVPAVVGFRLHELTTESNEFGQQVLKVNVYGKVEDLSRRVQYEFEDSMRHFVDPNETGETVFFYEKKLPLGPGRYKLTGVIKDENSDQMGFLEESLHIPKMAQGQLVLGSINLIRSIRKLEADLPLTDPFVVPGGMKIYPRLDGGFDEPFGALGVHFEIYRYAVSQDIGLPQLGSNITIYDQQGTEVHSERLPRESMKLVGHRVVVLHQLDVSKLPQGQYSLEVVTYDAIRDQTATAKTKFSHSKS